MRQLRIAAVAIIVTVLVAASAWAGATVTLKDGRKFTGQLLETSSQVSVATEEGWKTFAREEVAGIEYDAFSKASARQLKSFRTAQSLAEQVSLPAEAIAIWQKFIETREKGDPLLAEAQKELAKWAEASRDGKVVWGGKAMTPAERDLMMRRAMGLMDDAVVRIRKGDYQQAVITLREAARNWPGHPGISFFLGLALQKERRPEEAARQYRLVLDVFPQHVPTLSNLAALEVTRKQFRFGLSLLQQAMDLAGDVVVINDNSMRALLRAEDSGVRGLESDVNQLRNAGSRMESNMAARGMVRWGTSWVTRERLKGYEETNRQIDSQISGLAADVAALNQEVMVLASRIAELEHQRRSAPSEYDLQRDINSDGIPDLIIPRNAYVLTREKIDLILADLTAQVMAKDSERLAKLANIRKLKSGRLEPPRDLEFVLLEEPGQELLIAPPQPSPGVTPEPTAPAPLPAPVTPIAPATPSTPAIPAPPDGKSSPTATEDILAAIKSGKAIILDNDNTFLGKVTADVANAQSILNSRESFGSTTAQASVMNPAGPYGSRDGDRSVNNPSARNPPRLFHEGRFVAYLTVNPDLKPGLRLADLLAILNSQ